MNNPIPTSETKMKAKITVIETQCHRATIKRQLAKAQSDHDRSFFSPTAMTGHYAKVGNCQIDPTTVMTDVLAIDRVTYLCNIDTHKEETQLYMLKISMYKDESYLKLQKFTRACEHMYETQSVTYQSIKDQMMLTKGNF